LPEGVLLNIGNVNVEVVNHRRGLSDEIGNGRCCRHHHNLEDPLLIATAMIRHLDHLSDTLAGKLLTVLHLADADQLGLREFGVCGLDTWRKVLVGDLQRNDNLSYSALSNGGQSTPPRGSASPRSGEPTSGGTIRRLKGIIGFLCMSGYAPLTLYIRISLYRTGSMQDRASGLPRTPNRRT
jgi:hypothetical protein